MNESINQSIDQCLLSREYQYLHYGLNQSINQSINLCLLSRES